MPEMIKKVTCIVTYTGKIFELLNPKPEMVCIEDIAHSLSNLCRYTGHVNKFYSVAQHCVLMALDSELPGDPMAKLLHDASEAYIGDAASPWKKLLRLESNQDTEYWNISVREYESRIQAIVEEALGVGTIHSAEIKESDTRMFWAEVRDLMPRMQSDFEWGPPKMEPAKDRIIPWEPVEAERRFLDVYWELVQIQEA